MVGRPRKLFSAFGQSRTLEGWVLIAAEEFGIRISVALIKNRLSRGWNIEKAVFTPKRGYARMFDSPEIPAGLVSPLKKV